MKNIALGIEKKNKEQDADTSVDTVLCLVHSLTIHICWTCLSVIPKQNSEIMHVRVLGLDNPGKVLG